MERVSKQFEIFHFNDVYEIEAGTIEPVGGAARFVYACKKFRQQSGDNGLILFSGDLFSPSTLSVLYKGEQMLFPINECDVDVACVGNHEFDYTLEEISSLFRRCKFPWLCSNIFDLKTGGILAENHVYYVEEKGGVRIGIMGLAESEWLNTITEIDMSIVRYEDFVKCALQLSQILKKEHRCDVIIALTHMRNPNDLLLAASVPEIDLILGGHDHIVHCEKVNESLLIKSGADFKDFSTMKIEYGDFKSEYQTNNDNNRIIDENNSSEFQESTYIIKDKLKICIQFHKVTQQLEEDKDIQAHVNSYVEKSKAEMSKVIGFSQQPLDTRFSILRTQETNFGNFYADVIRKEVQSDIVLINSGTIRSDCIFPAGEITYAMLNKALPFPDIIVVQELSGSDIVAALENGVSKYPTFDGRFPLISGISFSFDGKKPTGERVDAKQVIINNQPIILEKFYSSATKMYVSQGKDGYTVFQDKKYILPYEIGLPHLQILVSFFKSLEYKYKQFQPVKQNEQQILNKQTNELESSTEEQRVSSSSFELRRSNSIISSESPSIPNIHVMRSVKRRQSRIEKVDNSGLVAAIRISHNDISYIVIDPQLDGRIKNISS